MNASDVAVQYSGIHLGIATELATMLPLTRDFDSPYVSLQEIAWTGINEPHFSFMVLDVDPEGTTLFGTIAGIEADWPDGDAPVIDLDEGTLRHGVRLWIADQLHAGSSVTDVVENLRDLDGAECDAILQFALYGQVLYS